MEQTILQLITKLRQIEGDNFELGSHKICQWIENQYYFMDREIIDLKEQLQQLTKERDILAEALSIDLPELQLWLLKEFGWLWNNVKLENKMEVTALLYAIAEHKLYPEED